MEKKNGKGILTSYIFMMWAQALSCMIPLSYTSMFLTDGLMMSAVVAAAAITLFKVLDFVLALVCGIVIDKANMRYGKYTSWVKIGQFCMFFGLILNFGDVRGMPIAVQFILVAIGYLLVQGSMNFVYTAVYGVVPVIGGDDMAMRNKLTSRATIFMCLANVISNFTMTPVILWAQGQFGIAWGYCVAAAIYTLPWFICSGWFVRKMKDYEHKRTPEEIAAQPTISVKEMLKCVCTNSQLLVATLAFSVFYIGFYCSFGSITYFFMYVLGDIRYYSIAQGITTCFGFIAAIIGARLGQKIGKKWSLVTGMAWMGCCGFLIWAFGAKGVAIYTVISCVRNVGMYMFQGFGAQYMIDAGEWQLYKTGKDNRAVCASCFNLPIKFGTMFGGSIAAFGLAAIGYEAGIVMDAAMKSKFMFIFGALGSFFILAASLIVTFGYKITDKDAAFYAAENQKRAQAAVKGE